MSGPLLDRIDIHIDDPGRPVSGTITRSSPEDSVRHPVLGWRDPEDSDESAFDQEGIYSNSQLYPKLTCSSHCGISEDSKVSRVCDDHDWACVPVPIIASSRWHAPLPTSPNGARSLPPISPRTYSDRQNNERNFA